MVPGAVYRSPGNLPYSGRKPRKISARRPSMRTVLPVIALPPNEVGRIEQFARKGKGRKEGRGGGFYLMDKVT
jgi:hypothetical protein